MIICGLKLTHDGAIALIDNGKLVFSYEMEKLNNNNRFSSLGDHYSTTFLISILKKHGYKLSDVDKIVIDGWWGSKTKNDTENDYPKFKLFFEDLLKKEIEVELSGYGLKVKDENILEKKHLDHISKDISFGSYMHISSHVIGAYCTSPLAKRKEDSFILVWDGGMFPQVFYMNANTKTIENLGPLFHLLGNGYSVFATNYPPYNSCDKDDMSVAGKVMAYIAKGKTNPKVLRDFKSLLASHEAIIQSNQELKAQELIDLSTNFLQELVIYGELNEIEHVDLMATFHVFLQEVILEKLTQLVSRYPLYKRNLCFVGGCALNIKWNTHIRNSGIFKEMWVPPFPNDSGSAIGTACCEMIAETDSLALDWGVYMGPDVVTKKNNNDSWDSMDCTLKELAQVIFSNNKPIVFLNGRAELGPRSLGNRSILANAGDISMKSELNRIKNREDYRPVAPICLEDDSEDIFSPGSPDPYMLYDHKVKNNWKDRIPAVCHLDGTARLQTVNKYDNPDIYLLLEEYKKLSGIPLLCNTSANYNGKGFFPDIPSVIEWGYVDFIWNEGQLYFNRDKLNELEILIN
jgi:carbamoyltransferase